MAYRRADVTTARYRSGPERLREVYAEPFAAAIRDASLGSIMSSYSCVDGLPGSGSAELLTRLLRDELGFDGHGGGRLLFGYPFDELSPGCGRSFRGCHQGSDSWTGPRTSGPRLFWGAPEDCHIDEGTGTGLCRGSKPCAVY